MTSAPLTKLSHITVKRSGHIVLEDICFSVRPGEFWGLIGPNGAGKSTLLGVFNGLTTIEKGSVSFKDQVLNSQTRKKIREQIAHVFQAIEIDPKIPISVFNTVLAGTYSRLGLFKKPQTHEFDLALKSLKAVGLEDIRHQPLGTLSGGQRQRVSIARALAQTPELMLLDEPTSALDWQAQRSILSLIESLRNEFHLTVVMATHDLNAVLSMCTHAVLLKDGKILTQGAVNDVINEATLTQLYGTPIRLHLDEDGKPFVSF